MSIVVHSYDLVAKRSDWRGAEIIYEAGSSEPITRIEILLEGDGEPAKVTLFPADEPRSDGRYNRRLGPKFTVNGGPFPLIVAAQDALGRRSSVRCTPGVTVVF